MFKTEQFNALQDGFKKHLSNTVFNVNSRRTYAYASNHFLFFCERLGCTEVYRLEDMLDYWHESLSKGVQTYKKHVHNHFVPYLISVNLSKEEPVSEPVPMQECEKGSYTNNEYEPPRKKRRIGELHINIDLCENKRKRRRENLGIRRVTFAQSPPPFGIGGARRLKPQPTIKQENEVEVVPQMEEYDDTLSKICVASVLFLMYSVISM